MRTLEEVQKDKRKLFAEEERILKDAYKTYIGKCFHVPDSPLWVKIIGIDRRNFTTVEIDSDFIARGKREFDSVIFFSSNEVAQEKFNEAYEVKQKQLLEEK